MKTLLLIFVCLMATWSAAAQPAEPHGEVFEELLVLAQPASPVPPVAPVPPGLPAPPPPEPSAAPPSRRSYLGIGVAEIDAERAKALKLSEERGVEITRVEPDSPAEKAGLKQGDVVLEYNGQRVEGAEQFVRMVRETPAGRRVTLLISRGGTTQTVTAVTGRREARDWPLGPEFQAQMERLRENLRDLENLRIQVDIPRTYMAWRASVLGVEAESLSQQLAEFFGVKEGVLVRSVSKGSAAEKAGIKAGDVITKVDGEAVRNPAQISNRLRRLRTKGTFPLTIVRNRQEMTITVTLPEPRREGGEPMPRPRTIVDQRGVRL